MSIIVASKKLILTLIATVSCQAVCAHTFDNEVWKHPFYVGFMGGYGSTTWGGLVPSEANQNLAISMSTPLYVEEGGKTFGFMAGYEVSPYFAFESNYIRYPRADVFFDTQSLFNFTYNGRTQFNTTTETAGLSAKIMLVVPDTVMRVYSSFGIANVHRQDMIVDDWRLSPTFGVGLNYHISEHFMGELAGNYTAGFGESQLNPTDTYFPFLYSATIRLAYCF